MTEDQYQEQLALRLARTKAAELAYVKAVYGLLDLLREDVTSVLAGLQTRVLRSDSAANRVENRLEQVLIGHRDLYGKLEALNERLNQLERKG